MAEDQGISDQKATEVQRAVNCLSHTPNPGDEPT